MTRGLLTEYNTCLVGNLEVVEERMAASNRALIDKRRPICPVGPSLEETVPMLMGTSQSHNNMQRWKGITMVVVLSMVWLVMMSITLSLKRSP